MSYNFLKVSWKEACDLVQNTVKIQTINSEIVILVIHNKLC